MMQASGGIHSRIADDSHCTIGNRGIRSQYLIVDRGAKSGEQPTLSAKRRVCGSGRDIQGQRTLSRLCVEDFEEYVEVPAASAALHGETVAVGLLF